MLLFLTVGCTDGDKGSDLEDTGGAPPLLTDTGAPGGGGGGQSWSPSGLGEAWLQDGQEDNSLFRLEMNYAIAPPEGQQYFGWLSGENVDSVALGSIEVVSDGTVVFEAELGFNGLVGGYDRFDAYAGTDEAEALASGTHLWSGQIETELREAYESLLISAEGTPDGEGTLRAVETTTEIVQAHIQAAIGKEDVLTIHVRAEEAANAIEGTEEDIDGNGMVATMDGTMAILGDEGLIERILGGLDVASAAVEPGHPVKDLANWAYDCTQRIESFATEAYTRARIATACASSSSCDDNLRDAEQNLGWALEGMDIDKDEVVDLQDEGTIECAIYYVSRMAVMDVGVP